MGERRTEFPGGLTPLLNRILQRCDAAYVTDVYGNITGSGDHKCQHSIKPSPLHHYSCFKNRTSQFVGIFGYVARGWLCVGLKHTHLAFQLNAQSHE